MTGPIACLGLGYTASRFAYIATKQGFEVRGTTGNAELRQKLSKAGIRALPREPGNETRTLDGATALIVSAPPGGNGCPIFTQHHSRIRSGELAWMAYLSSTAVYGDRGGAWVDEEARIDPPNAGPGQRRHTAERMWQQFGEETGIPVAILRLAGIYGPGRGFLSLVRKGWTSRIDKPGHVFSRIHVDDIVRILLAGLAQRIAGVFNVADGHPASQADVAAEACRLLGKEVPEMVPFGLARESMSPSSLRRWMENRKVRAEKILSTLGIDLLYPDYLSGFRATLAEEKASSLITPRSDSSVF